MAKKGANQGEKLNSGIQPKGRIRQLVKQQADRRAGGKVYRFEVTFSVNDSEQVYIADKLGAMPRGGASTFIRAACFEKIARERNGDPVAQLEELYRTLFEDQERRHRETLNELAALKAQLSNFKVETVTATRVSAHPEPHVESSGLDMSRPRPRKALPSTPSKPVFENHEMTPEEEYDNRMKLVNSIKAFSGAKSG